MKAISICGPWWWYILHGYKPVENRTWPSSYRGPLLIQVSQKILAEDRTEAQRMAMRAGYTGLMPDMAELQAMAGRIAGQVTMVDCVREHPSPFFGGPFGHVYTNPLLFKDPVKCRGYQQLFDVDVALVAEATRTNTGAGDLFAGVE